MKSVKSPCGRKKNPGFDQLGFDLLKVNDKYEAVCTVCRKHLKNTAFARLRGHRKVCKTDIQVKNNNYDDNKSNLCIMKENNTTDAADKIADIMFETSDCSIEFCDVDRSIEMSTSENRVEAVWLPMPSTSNNLNTYTFFPLSKPISLKTSSELKTYNASVKNTTKNIADALTPKDIEEINTHLANFIFGCNLPLHIVESKHFKNFISHLRPAYVKKIPDQTELSTTLLNKSYETCISNTKNNLGPQSVLLVNECKNSANSKIVVALIRNSNGEQTFLDTWDLSDISETDEKLVNIIIEAIDRTKTLYSTNVYAVVCNNANAMTNMGRLSKSIWYTTCNSHIVNLLTKDITNKSLTDNVILILKEFKHAELEKALIEKGGYKINLPRETELCSYRNSYCCLIENLEQMKSIVVDKSYKKVKRNIVQLLFNNEFINTVKEYIELFDSVCNIINKCQKKSTSIADAVYLWKTLKLPPKFESEFRTKIEMRKNMALNLFSVVAYYLHPHYDNSNLSQPEQYEIFEFLIDNLDGAGIEEWEAFRNKNGLFETLYAKNIQSPLVFWSTADLKYKKISQLALKLLNIPASTPQTERLFLDWECVHGPLLRNSLSFEMSKKLLHVYYSLQMTKDNEEDLTEIEFT